MDELGFEPDMPDPEHLGLSVIGQQTNNSAKKEHAAEQKDSEEEIPARGRRGRVTRPAWPAPGFR